MNTFVEGVSVVVQPCTLVIALPTLALVLVAQRTAPAVAAASIVASAVMMWARAAGYWTLASDGVAIVLISVVIVAGFTVVRSNVTGLSILGAVGCGAVVGWLWQPCVGEGLAEILNTAETKPISSLARMTVYTAGALLPAILLAAAPHAWPSARHHIQGPWPARIGLTFGAIYGAAVLSGRYDDLIGVLSHWSSA